MATDSEITDDQATTEYARLFLSDAFFDAPPAKPISKTEIRVLRHLAYEKRKECNRTKRKERPRPRIALMATLAAMTPEERKEHNAKLARARYARAERVHRSDPSLMFVVFGGRPPEAPKEAFTNLLSTYRIYFDLKRLARLRRKGKL